MSGQELTELENFYYWFYSTIIQSLAALIGIVGVFVIFRIQMLVNIIKNKSEELQLLVNTERWEVLGVLNAATVKEDISISINKIIDQLSNLRDRHEDMIQHYY